MTRDSEKQSSHVDDEVKIIIEGCITPDSQFCNDCGSGWKRFLSENPQEIYDTINLLILQKQCGNDTKKFDDETVAKCENY